MLSHTVFVIGEEVVRHVMDRIQSAINENRGLIKIMADASATLADALQKQNNTLVDLLTDVRTLLNQPAPDVTAAIAAIDAATESMATLDVEVESRLTPPTPPPTT